MHEMPSPACRHIVAYSLNMPNCDCQQLTGIVQLHMFYGSIAQKGIRGTMVKDAGRQLRQQVEERRALLVPGVMNALAARVAEDLGYEALYITGAGVTNALLGLPDVGLISPTQMAD